MKTCLVATAQNVAGPVVMTTEAYIVEDFLLVLWLR